jgi:lysophospholipase L1-like esterase
MTTIRNRRAASGTIRGRSTTPPGDWEAPAPLDWGIPSEAERAAGRTAQASRPVEPRRRRSALPGWLRAILFLPAAEAPMAHRDARLADLDRTMAHKGATKTGLHTVAASLDRVAVEPRRRILTGMQRRREAGAVLALLLVAILISVAGPIPGLGSSVDPTPIYIMIGDNGSGGDYTQPPSVVPLVPVGTAAQDPTILPPPPTKAPTKKPAAAPARVRTYVALGDSLTAWPSYNPWPSRLDKSDALLRLLNNAGVPGNTTAQMRARLNIDVFPYKPEVLFVLGGTNDLGYGYSESSIIANLRAIVVAAKARKMVVVLVYVPPDSYTSMVPKIKSLNQAIWNLAVSQNVHIADIWTPLATANGTINSKYTSDGLHFSDLGCQVVSNAIWARMKRLGM